MNTISIILPFYNSEQFLGAMLASIAQQSERDFELILINDASTDSSLQIAEQFVQCTADQFKSILISHTQNRGLVYSINEGMKAAKGRYIALADHDDIWLPEKLSIQMHVLETNGKLNACLCDRTLIDENGRTVLQSEYRFRNFKKKEATLDDVLKRKIRHSSNTFFFRNIGYSELEIPASFITHDLYLAFVLAKTGNLYYHHTPLVRYRIHRKNLSANYYYFLTYSFKRFAQVYRSIKERRNLVRDGDLSIINSMLSHQNHPKRMLDKERKDHTQSELRVYLKKVIKGNLKRILINWGII